MRPIVDIMKLCPVIPVLVIDRLEDAAPMARALVAGGLKVLEVTLRTPAGLAAITAMKEAAPEAVVGAGTVNSAALLADAAKAGAEFIVSPGLTAAIANAAKAHDLPFLPGVATAGDILHGLELGLGAFKFFPAETSGGAAAIKALEGPFPGLDICPTGGITLANAPTYLALDSVRCVGGSWITPKDAVKSGDWARVTALAAEAAQLKR
jgi:2-dehydro-3-deoxyphosphogluconate aldolase / (4S)-4-hydroxy-2-oxoglutarate aldolase